MGLSSVYLGRRTWEDYIVPKVSIASFEKAVECEGAASYPPDAAHTMRVALSPSDYQIALESGLGALAEGLTCAPTDSVHVIEFAFEKLGAGIDQLNADFNLLLGDVIWKLELYQETLSNILQEIRLAEFEREARAYRSRAEKAYLSGWYEEALKDFLEAETRNYTDFTV